MKIQSDLKDKCIRAKSSPRKELECSAIAINEASTEHGLTKQWEKVRPQLEKHLDSWKQCVYQLYVTTKFIFINIVKLTHCHTLTESIQIFIYVFEFFQL